MLAAFKVLNGCVGYCLWSFVLLVLFLSFPCAGFHFLSGLFSFLLSFSVLCVSEDQSVR